MQTLSIKGNLEHTTVAAPWSTDKSYVMYSSSPGCCNDVISSSPCPLLENGHF